MKYIVSYGSLRSGGDWFRSIYIKYKNLNLNPLDNIKFIKVEYLEGFRLYRLRDNEVPTELNEEIVAGVFTGSNEDRITIDIIEVSDKVYEDIMKLIKVSPFEPHEINIKTYPCVIFIYDNKIPVEEELLIPSGNYFVRNANKQKIIL